MAESVQLLSITPDAEKTILKVARVSSNQDNTDPGLIKYLIRQKHWSPFTLAHAVVQFETSRTIAHQMIRHWSMACLEVGEVPGIQEMSQRYTEAPGMVKYIARRQADKNRQSSIDDLDDFSKSWFDWAQQEVEARCSQLYTEAIERGIARECARFLLPEATSTKIILAGSLRSWIHYLNERCSEDTQLEHRELALQARYIIAPHVPTIAEVLNWA